MILSMRMRNIALIEELSLEFGEGLHVMTGETGAGKSIVVDAVNLVLGGRAAHPHGNGQGVGRSGVRCQRQ